MQRTVILVLVGVGCFTFFLPLVGFHAPIVGETHWSAFDIVSGIFHAGSREQPSFESIAENGSPAPQSKGEQETQNTSVPLSVLQAVLFPFAAALVYLVLCLLAVAEFLPTTSTRKKWLSFVGMASSLYGLLSVFLLNNGLHEGLNASLSEAGSESSPFTALGQAFAQSIRIEPGAGLYLLCVIIVLLFLAQKLRLFERIIIQEATSATPPASALGQVEAEPQATFVSKYGRRRKQIYLLAGILIILIGTLYAALYIRRGSGLGASGATPLKAREELAKMNIQYDRDSFLEAAAEGDSLVVRRFLEAGMDPNTQDPEHRLGALSAAVLKGHAETAELLLKKGADPNAREADGYTPFLIAVRGGSARSVSMLLDRGGDMNARLPDGTTALMIAVVMRKTDNVKVLLDRGADVNLKGEERGVTALMIAALKPGDSEIVTALLKKGADANAQSKDGGTALMFAAGAGDTETVKALLERGAGVNARTRYGQTALSIAAQKDNLEIVTLLKNGGTVRPALPLSAEKVSVGCSASVLQGAAGKGGGSVDVNGFTIQVEPDPNPDAKLCHAIVRSAQGDVVFRYDDWGIDVDPVTGRDVDGDGQPDAVLVGYSGGAHCCWTYSIVSLGQKPGLIRHFENRAPASFEDRKVDGHIEILVRGGEFDGFDGLAQAYSPSPLLILRLEGTQFRDVGSEFRTVYDNEIGEWRAKIEAPSLEKFLHSNPAEMQGDPDYVEIRGRVLQIVLDYLYSGRSESAWKSLGELWPTDDRARIRAEMLDKYCNGLRAELGVGASPACTNASTDASHSN